MFKMLVLPFSNRKFVKVEGYGTSRFSADGGRTVRALDGEIGVICLQLFLHSSSFGFLT